MRTVISDYAPRTLSLTKYEYQCVYPRCTFAKRIDILFPRGTGRAEIEDKVAEYLVKKHNGLHLEKIEEPTIPIVEEAVAPVIEITPTVEAVPEIDININVATS